MNWIVLIAGLLSAIGLINHLFVGRKKSLAPLLLSTLDPMAKTVLRCQYYYVSVTVCLATAMMIVIGLKLWIGFTAVLFFIAANYLACAVVQFVIALGSGIPRGILKLNTWLGLVIVAVLLIVGG